MSIDETTHLQDEPQNDPPHPDIRCRKEERLYCGQHQE